MAIYEKQCECCGKIFNPPNRKYKYCSADCREQARLAIRKAWEEKTDYATKNVEAVRRSREKKLASKLNANQKAVEELNKQREEEFKDWKKKRRAKLKQRVKNGDALAIMDLHTMYDKEYWDAYKDYMLTYATEHPTGYIATINGFKVCDEDFTDNVLDSIANGGFIRGSQEPDGRFKKNDYQTV